MALRPLVPVADSVLVLLLALVVLPEPLQQFWRALRQSAGAACDPGLIAHTRDAVQELLSGMSAWLLDLTVMKVGRTTFVVAYLNPAMPWMGPGSIGCASGSMSVAPNSSAPCEPK